MLCLVCTREPPVQQESLHNDNTKITSHGRMFLSYRVGYCITNQSSDLINSVHTMQEKSNREKISVVLFGMIYHSTRSTWHGAWRWGRTKMSFAAVARLKVVHCAAACRCRYPLATPWSSWSGGSNRHSSQGREDPVSVKAHIRRMVTIW